MKKYKIITIESCDVEFEYEVLANSKDEALEKLKNGEYEDCEDMTIWDYHKKKRKIFQIYENDNLILENEL